MTLNETTKLPVLSARFPPRKRVVEEEIAFFVAQVQEIGRRDREDGRRDVPGEHIAYALCGVQRGRREILPFFLFRVSCFSVKLFGGLGNTKSSIF